MSIPTRALVVGLLVTGCLVIVGRPVAADPVAVGWWSTAPAAAYADVPPDGLVVQGGAAAGQPVAYSAIATAITPGATAVSITLATAPQAVSTPGAMLVACLLSSQLTPVQGGRMADAPPFDCGVKVTVTPSPGSPSYTFDVGQFIRNGAVGVAILPTQATDRVVLQRPGTDAIRVTGGGVAAQPSSPDAPSTEEVGDSSLPTELATSQPPSVTTDSGPAEATPLVGSGSASPSNEGGAASVLPSRQSPAVAKAALNQHGGGLVWVLFCGVLALALTLWRVASRSPATLLAAASGDGAALFEGEDAVPVVAELDEE